MSAPARAAGGQEQATNAGQGAGVVAETRRPRRARKRHRRRRRRGGRLRRRRRVGARAQPRRERVAGDGGPARSAEHARAGPAAEPHRAFVGIVFARIAAAVLLVGEPARVARRARAAGQPAAPRGARAGRHALARERREPWLVLSRRTRRRRQRRRWFLSRELSRCYSVDRAPPPDAGRRGRHRRRAARRASFSRSRTRSDANKRKLRDENRRDGFETRARRRELASFLVVVDCGHRSPYHAHVRPRNRAARNPARSRGKESVRRRRRLGGRARVGAGRTRKKQRRFFKRKKRPGRDPRERARDARRAPRRGLAAVRDPAGCGVRRRDAVADCARARRDGGDAARPPGRVARAARGVRRGRVSKRRGENAFRKRRRRLRRDAV